MHPRHLAQPSGGWDIYHATDRGSMRYQEMDTLDQLQARMDAAAALLDFEEARRLRDQIALIRSGASPEAAQAADTRGLSRQQPGAMGLGTSQQKVTPPVGWKPPPKPDLMTRNHSKRR